MDGRMDQWIYGWMYEVHTNRSTPTIAYHRLPRLLVRGHARKLGQRSETPSKDHSL